MRTVLLSLFTAGLYSAVATLLGRGRRWHTAPVPSDVVALVLIWTILAAMPALPLGTKLPIAAGLALVGALVINVTKVSRNRRQAKAGFSHVSPHGDEPASGLREWRRLIAACADFQTRLFVLLVYFVLITPFGAILRIAAAATRARSAQPISYWQVRQDEAPNLQSARRQF